jgi:hypothetical protein
MDSESLRQLIKDNAVEITRLNSRINETVKLRDQSPAKKQEWQQACAEFHAKIGGLAFPGGYSGALERIVAGDSDAMEAAICFLEVRPFFFRSGYMFKDILKRAKRAPLSKEQAARLATIEQRLTEWRAKKGTA